MCAFVLHLAFPRANLPWLAVPALAGLFAVWSSLSMRDAAIVGYVTGVVFFAFDASWVGETAGSLLGPFAFVLDIAPALLEAWAFAVAAVITAYAAQRLYGAWIPLVAAAGFSCVEWLRSIGILGAPFYQIGTPFVATPLAPLAASIGGGGLTFVVALAAAALARAARERKRASILSASFTLGAIALATGAAWSAWPARSVLPGTIRVAAIQGNITQTLKWGGAPALATATERYVSMTQSLAAFHPQLVVWPETVITTYLVLDPAIAHANPDLAREANRLQRRFGALARSLDTQLVIGSVEAGATDEYNDLFVFDAGGALSAVYRKRQLVPFAEFLPGPAWLRALPFASLVSHFGHGTSAAVIGPLGIAPLICWESAFGDLAQAQAARGARLLVIATDDAWFGVTDGPYVHAQIARLRAVETGRWVIRAAATGISGIIAPDGTWRARSSLATQAVITGTVGPPEPTLFSRFGPQPVGLALTLLAALGCLLGRRRT